MVYDIDEIWSIDLAYFDKLAKYYLDVKNLLVAVHCMSPYLRVQPLKSKYATTTVEAFKLMITTKRPKKYGWTRAQNFKFYSKHYENIKHKKREKVRVH